MNDLTDSFRSMHNMNLCAITAQPGCGYQMMPLGFVLEFGLVVVLSILVPRSVPTLMGWIWPETITN